MGISFDANAWGAQFAGADSLSADSSYDFQRIAGTVATDAVQSMQPVSEDSGGGEWGSFFRDLGKGVTGYLIARDARQTGVLPAAPRSPGDGGTGAHAAQAPPPGQLMMLLLIGAAVFVAIKVAK